MILKIWLTLSEILFFTFLPTIILVILDIVSIVKKKRNSIIIYTTYIVIWFILFITAIIFGIIYDRTHDEYTFIREEINIDVKSCGLLKSKDTHALFLGDGETFIKFDCSNSKEEILKQIKDFNEYPLTDNLQKSLKLNKTTEKLLKVKNGYYYFTDRNTDAIDIHDDKDLFSRSSFNYTLVIYDIDNNILYYYNLDT